MGNLTKRDLVLDVCKHADLPYKTVDLAIQRLLDKLMEALVSGKKVELRNFGVFDTKLRKERVGRNPKNPNKDVIIPAHAIVRFRAGKQMRKRLIGLTARLSLEKKDKPNAQERM
jgi:DNA-binding protein HU-beta/integration host factor subunit alpha